MRRKSLAWRQRLSNRVFFFNKFIYFCILSFFLLILHSEMDAICFRTSEGEGGGDEGKISLNSTY